MISALVLATLLTIKDPVNDAFGSGKLVPPNSESHVASALDVTEFSILDEPTLALKLVFGSLANPFDRVLGFSFPIVELYFQDNNAALGASQLLEGSGMFLPEGAYWNYAIRLTGDKAELFEGQESAIKTLEPISLFLEDSSITLKTQVLTPQSLSVYGIVGYYSPFSQTGWQSISPTLSPWAYSSQEAHLPVIEVISSSSEAQLQALQQGVIPSMGSSAKSSPNYWNYVMVAGLVIASIGLLIRIRTRVESKASLETEAVPVTVEHSAASVAAFESFLQVPNSQLSQPQAAPPEETQASSEPEQQAQLLLDETEDAMVPAGESSQTQQTQSASPELSQEASEDDPGRPEAADQVEEKPAATEVELANPIAESSLPAAFDFDFSEDFENGFPDNTVWDEETELVWHKPEDSKTSS